MEKGSFCENSKIIFFLGGWGSGQGGGGRVWGSGWMGTEK